MQFDLKSRQVRWGIFLAAFSVYVLLFFLLYPRFGEGSAALAILPVAVIAWSGGSRFGLLAGLLSFPLNTLLLNMIATRADPWAVVIQSGGGPGSVAIVFIGLIVGLLHHQREKSARQLSQRQQTEQALRASQLMFQGLFDSSPDAVIVANSEGQILQVNAQVEVLFGYQADELLGQPVEILLPKHLQVHHAHQRAHYITNPHQRPMGTALELHGRRKDGSEFPVDISLGILATQASPVVLATVRDITERKHMEEALRASESRYRLATQATNDVIWEWSAKTHKLTWTDNAKMVFGYAMEEIGPDETWWDNHIHPEDRLRVISRLNALIKGSETIWSAEYRFLLEDGSYAYISDHAYIERDASGAAIRMIGAMANITERVRAEEALRQSEERFKLIAWATKDAVWDWDLQTDQIWWGEGLQKIFHYSSELAQTNADWWLDHIHPDDRTKVQRAIDQALQGGLEFWSKEYRFQREDGTYAEIMDRGYILRDGTGKPYRMIGAMLDITERNRSLNALQESERRFRSLFDNMTSGYAYCQMLFTPDNKPQDFIYVAVNPEFESVTGLRNVVGKKVSQVIPGVQESNPELFEIYGRVALTGKPERFESYIDSLGIWFWISVYSPEPGYFVAVFDNITERKAMETSLFQANEAMRQFLMEEERRNREIALLNEMGRLLQACGNMEESYRVIVELSDQMFPGTAGALYLLNTAGTLVNAVAAWGELPSDDQAFTPDHCVALLGGQIQLLGEDQNEPTCTHLSAPPPAVSYCLPMQVQDEILGILHVQSQDKANLDGTKRQLAYTIVEQAGLALSNLKLREALLEQSIHDPLTGLYNRRYMEEALKQQVSRVNRLMHSLGLIMIDIDYFKSFNDVHGHAAGDALLREIGQFLQQNIRVEDIACRYGGEEFILILPDISLEVVRKRVEHLLREVRKLRIPGAGGLYKPITVSLGIAIYPQHGRDIETAMRAADQALYRAKREGRDRAVVAELCE